MQIYELRKILSKNKKYRYVYQVIIDGIVINEKKTSIEYNGCILLAGAIYTFFNSDNIALVLSTFHASKKVNQDIAITFDSLKNLKNI